MADKLVPMVPNSLFHVQSQSLKNMAQRIGKTDLPNYYYKSTIPGANGMAVQLITYGGVPQQERMIRDKRKSLDRATLYSYQAAQIRKCSSLNPTFTNITEPVRALINPDKTKFDYDNKVLSVGFEHDFHPGDVFEWCRTHSYWLITLQDLSEIAYFRGEIRRCDYVLNWVDKDGLPQSSYIAVRGPVETKINFIQKHGISVDEPNHSLHIYMPRTPAAVEYFQRYAKFYLSSADDPISKICWRVEAVDAVSTLGILELNAVEYYANQFEDDTELGVVGAKIEKLVEPESNLESAIIGDTFIKPKVEYIYYVNTQRDGQWKIAQPKIPVVLEAFVDEHNYSAVKLKWNSSYSGQFDLVYSDILGNDITSKTIVVESLF